MSKVIDAMYSPFRKSFSKINTFLKNKTGVDIAKYSLLSTAIVAWAIIAFLQTSKNYTLETGIALAVIVAGIFAYDFLKTKKKVDKDAK